MGLRFAMQEEGRSVEYELVRTWSEKSGKMRESFEVLKDGKNDRGLSELWSDHIQEILPPRIAPLFFFDGEKIEELADLKRAPGLVREAVKSLLGLDIVSQLDSDLEILERRKFASVAAHGDQKKLQHLEEQLARLESNRTAVSAEIAQARAQVAEHMNERDRANASFREAGGELFNQHEALVAHQTVLGAERERTLGELRQLAIGVLPLALVAPIIKRMVVQGELELSYEAADRRYQALQERDEFVEGLIRSELKNAASAKNIIQALRADLKAKKPKAAGSFHLGIMESAHSNIRNIESAEIPAALDRARQLLVTVADHDRQLSAVQRKVTAVPDGDTIQALTDRIAQTVTDIHANQAKLEERERRLSEIERELIVVQRSLKQLIEQRVVVHNENADAERIIKYSQLVRESLDTFVGLVVKHHIRRIEVLVEEALKKLFRKENLIGKVTIDSQTFEISLRDGKGEVIPSELLSAGERQLLATSLLWALAVAAGRQIPTAIDTPLGRLDSVHRHKLVDCYFPQASHQVILLSTDEEIAGAYYNTLLPSISHSFTLRYNDQTRSSQIENGYAFATEVASVH